MDAQTRKDRYNEIIDCLRAGGAVLVCTYTRATKYDSRHVDYFKVTDSGLYVRSGKRWNCIDYCAIRFGRKA